MHVLPVFPNERSINEAGTVVHSLSRKLRGAASVRSD